MEMEMEMEMRQLLQCVPCWDKDHLDDNNINPSFPFHLPNPTLQYGVAAELTWQHGLPTLAPTKQQPPRAPGTTLHSLLLNNNQAAAAAAHFNPIKSSFNNNHLQAPPWFDNDHPNVCDGVVPVRDQAEIMGDGRESSTRVGSCSSGATVPVVEESVSTGTFLCRATSSSLELESRSSWEGEQGSYNSSSSSSSSTCGEDKTYTTVVWTQDHQVQDNDDSSSYKPQDHHHSLSQPSIPHAHAHAQARSIRTRPHHL